MLYLAGWRTAAVFLAAALPTMGERRLPVVVSISLILPTAGWFVIERLLEVHIPTSLLGI